MRLRPAGIAVILSSFCLAAVCGQNEPREGKAVSYRLRHPALHELSGLAVSRKNKGWVWVHNDRGNRPYLYAVQFAGRQGFRYEVTRATANDWEDLSQAEDRKGRHWLFIADTGRKGDPRIIESRQCLWVIEEPRLPVAGPATRSADDAAPLIPEFHKAKSPEAKRIDLYFPKGRTPDVEAIFTLPGLRGICCVDKKKGGRCRIYRGLFPGPPEDGFPERLDLEDFAELSCPGEEAIDRRITSACLDREGRELFLISRTRLFAFPWPPFGKQSGGPKKKKKRVKPHGNWPLPKLQQSEAIDIATNNKELMIVSEGRPAVFHIFARPARSGAKGKSKGR